jgi:hypothetical protein
VVVQVLVRFSFTWRFSVRKSVRGNEDMTGGGVTLQFAFSPPFSVRAVSGSCD